MLDPTRWLGVLGCVAVVAGAMALGAPLPSFFDPAGLALVALGALAGGAAAAGRDLGALGAALGRRGADRPTLVRAATAAAALRRSTWVVGIVFTVVHGIHITRNLDDPAAFGPSLTVLLLPLLHAGLLDLLLASPLVTRLRLAALATPAPTETPETTAPPALTETGAPTVAARSPATPAELDAALDTLRRIRARQSSGAP